MNQAYTPENERDAAIFDLLTDPNNNPWIDSRREGVEWLDEREDAADGIQDIIDVLREALYLDEGESPDGKGMYAFEAERIFDPDGALDSVNLLAPLGPDRWICASSDAKYFYAKRYGLSGTCGAVRVARNLLDEWARALLGSDVVVTDRIALLAGLPAPEASSDSGKLSDSLKDRTVVDAIALYLGTRSSWSGSDALDVIADLIGEVRPHPGDTSRPYLDAFQASRAVDPRTEGFLAHFLEQ